MKQTRGRNLVAMALNEPQDRETSGKLLNLIAIFLVHLIIQLI